MRRSRRRLGTDALVDDGVADEIPERGGAAVMAVRSERAHAAQARNGKDIEHAVVGFGSEERRPSREGAGSRRDAGNEESAVRCAVESI